MCERECVAVAASCVDGLCSNEANGWMMASASSTALALAPPVADCTTQHTNTGLYYTIPYYTILHIA